MTKLNLEEKIEDVQLIWRKIDHILDDGKVTMPELLGVLPTVTADLMELAGGVARMTGPEKKEFVIEALQYGYRAFNPDIPWLPQWIEDPLEELMLSRLLPELIEALYTSWNGDRNFGPRS